MEFGLPSAFPVRNVAGQWFIRYHLSDGARWGGEFSSTFVRVHAGRSMETVSLTKPAQTEGSRITSVIDARSLNLPNAITLSRFVLALVLFCLISTDRFWQTSAVVFIIAALTDFLDGYLARKYGQVTVLGRILDPFVDKIIICGSFIFLMAWPKSGVTAWVTFAIVAREMFITQLRAFMEQRGTDFSAKWSGKIKMGLQCTAVPLCLLSLSPEFMARWQAVFSQSQLVWVRDISIWATVAITVYSGAEYSWRAFQILRRPAVE